MSTEVWQATEHRVVFDCDLGFEVGKIQESDAESKVSSMSGGSGMLGTFLWRKRLTTVTGNISKINA